MRYQKKPVVIEAIQFTQDNVDVLNEWLGSNDPGPLVHYGWQGNPGTGETTKLLIRTLEGEMVADVGDWIIRGVKGEFYPCKPDIFEMTYEAVIA